MVKKIFIMLSCIVLLVAFALSLIVYYLAYSSGGRNVFLYANEKQGAKLNKKQDGGEKINAFFASPYENLSLYKPSSKTNEILSNNFYGNLDNYNYINNPSTNLYLFQNDFASEQLVIKTKNLVSSMTLSALINNDGLHNDDITIVYGFNRYIYASNNSKIPSPLSIREPLLVPDAITNNHSVNVTSNNVYILWIKFLSAKNAIRNDSIYKVKLSLNGVEQELRTDLDVHLHIKDKTITNKVSDFNIYSFFGWTAQYYNANKVPNEINNPADEKEYFQYNWSRYWEPEAKYMHDIYGMDYFQLPVSLSCVPDINYNDNWQAKRFSKVQTFLHWYVKDTDDLKNHLYQISQSDWDAFDDFINGMASIGYTKMFLTGWQYGWFYSNTTYVWNEETKSYVGVEMNMTKDEGKINNQWIFKEMIDHIKSKRNSADQKENANWKKLTFYLYLDELPDNALRNYTTLIDQDQSLNPNRSIMKLAICDWERDLDYYDQDLQSVDILYIYFLDVYNEENTNFKKLLHQRTNKNLITGQYSLDADYTFNLTRAEPGVLTYMMLALYKEGSPHFMRYILQGWTLNKSYWSSDYNEDFSNINYVSGDTTLAYPFTNVVDTPADISENTDPYYDYFNPSVRLENLALGTNINNKIQYLKDNNLISDEQLNNIFNAINQQTKQAEISSSTKFNFNFNDTNVSYNSTNNSFIYHYLNQTSISEIQVVKVINNIIDECLAKL